MTRYSQYYLNSEFGFQSPLQIKRIAITVQWICFFVIYLPDCVTVFKFETFGLNFLARKWGAI